MSYLAELKIIFDVQSGENKEEKITKYVISSEKRDVFLKLLKELTKNIVPEDIK